MSRAYSQHQDKMFYSDTDQVRTQMNASGEKQKPFLFGVNYEMSEGFFVEHPLAQSEIEFQILGIGNKKNKPQALPEYHLNIHALPFEEYASKYNTVQQGLKDGNISVLNLTAKTPIETNLSISNIFSLSNSPYQLHVPNKFVCFSPERFVKIENGTISTNPMKGTIDASIPNAEEVIQTNPKELDEHQAVVDLMLEEIALVANDASVSRFRYIDRIETNNKTILQVSSEVVGTLPNDYQKHLGDIIFDLLPGTSIAGVPKKPSIELIQKAEQQPRGYYTGIFGYYDGKTLDTGVLIRFIEQEGDQLFFRSGGGVTAQSSCEKEYKEMLNKIYLPFV